MRREETQIERSLTGNKEREKAQTESSTTRKVRVSDTQETFEESEKVEYAAEAEAEEVEKVKFLLSASA